jgi:hypothetical protein
VKYSVLLCIYYFYRLDASEDIDENRRNLIALTQKVFDAIISSADKYDNFFPNVMEFKAVDLF